MRAYIHIGTEKTGSTTIQAFLMLNRRRLAAQGTEIVFPEGYRTSRPFVTWAIDPDTKEVEFERLGLEDIPAREKWKEGFREEFRDYMKRKREKSSHFIFSSEHFHSRLNRGVEVERLKGLLDEFFDEYRIVVYLRRQDILSRSRFSTTLKTGHVPRDLLSGGARGTYFDYYSLLKRWTDAFGKESLDARRFGREFFVEGDLLADFCDACGIPGQADLERPSEKNQALSAVAQSAMLELNLHFPNSRGSAEDFHRALRWHCRRYLIKHFPGKCLMPSREEALAYYEQFVEGNERMYEEFFDGERIFDDDFSMYPEERTDPCKVPGYREALLEALADFDSSVDPVVAKTKNKLKQPIARLWKQLRRRV